MKNLKFVVCVLSLLLTLPLFAQGGRGKADLKAGGGSVTIDYGRPSSPRDRVVELAVGDSWRMGKDAATVLKTSADLAFGSTSIAKGSYSLFLKRTTQDNFELVFNSQTGQWGTVHDEAKDVARVALQREDLPSLVETFTIELKGSQGGGSFVMSWGKTKLSADFKTK